MTDHRTLHGEDPESRRLNQLRQILEATAIKPRGLLELQQMLGIKRTQTQTLIALLHGRGDIHGVRIGRVIRYVPGRGPKISNRTELPKTESRDYAVLESPIIRRDGTLDQTHRVVRFGDLWPQSHGISTAHRPKCGTAMTSTYLVP